MIKEKGYIILPVITLLLFCLMIFTILVDNGKIEASEEYYQIIGEQSEETLKISINNSTIDDLVSLPRIGEAIAQRIIDYRNVNGDFESIDEIKNVKGIGDSVFEEIKHYICI